MSFEFTIHDPPRLPLTNPDHESQFDQAHGVRPGAESVMSSIKHNFHNARAPAVGNGRNHFILICAALLNNAKAELARRARLEREQAQAA